MNRSAERVVDTFGRQMIAPSEVDVREINSFSGLLRYLSKQIDTKSIENQVVFLNEEGLEGFLTERHPAMPVFCC